MCYKRWLNMYLKTYRLQTKTRNDKNTHWAFSGSTKATTASRPWGDTSVLQRRSQLLPSQAYA